MKSDAFAILGVNRENFLYSSVSDLKDKKMKYWNMHTYSNKLIDSSKILLLKDKYSASKILKQLIDDNIYMSRRRKENGEKIRNR